MAGEGTTRVREKELVEGFLRGARDATKVVDGWIAAVLHGSFCSLREEWDDLKQEIRLRLLQNLRSHRFKGRSSLRTYVHRISRNTCIDTTRRIVHRHETPAPKEADLPLATKKGVLAEWISRDLQHKLLDGLLPADRTLLDLILRQDCSYVEAAERLGVSKGAIKVRMFRCRQRMSKLYVQLVGR